MEEKLTSGAQSDSCAKADGQQNGHGGFEEDGIWQGEGGHVGCHDGGYWCDEWDTID